MSARTLTEAMGADPDLIAALRTQIRRIQERAK